MVLMIIVSSFPFPVFLFHFRNITWQVAVSQDSSYVAALMTNTISIVCTDKKRSSESQLIELPTLFRKYPVERKVVWSDDSLYVLVLAGTPEQQAIAVYSTISQSPGFLSVFSATNPDRRQQQQQNATVASESYRCVDIVSVAASTPANVLLIYSNATAAHVYLSASGQPDRVSRMSFECGGTKAGNERNKKEKMVESAVWLAHINALLLMTANASGIDSTLIISVFKCEFPSVAMTLVSMQDLSITRGPSLLLSVDGSQSSDKSVSMAASLHRGGSSILGMLLGNRIGESTRQSHTAEVSMPVQCMAISPDDRLMMILFTDGYVTLLEMRADSDVGSSLQRLCVLSERFRLQPESTRSSNIGNSAAAATTDQSSSSTAAPPSSAAVISTTEDRVTTVHFLSDHLFAAVTAQGRVELFHIHVTSSTSTSTVSIVGANHFADALPPPLGPCCTTSSCRLPTHLLKDNETDHDNITSNLSIEGLGSMNSINCRLVFLRAIDAWTSQVHPYPYIHPSSCPIP